MELTPYHRRTSQPAIGAPRLAGDITVDVCVVGGGIAGCSAALHLAKRGFSVALLESQDIGWGASGRSGGQVLPGYSCGLAGLANLVGPAMARCLWDVSVEGVDLVRSLVQTHAIDCDLQSEHLEVALNLSQRDGLLKSLRLHAEYGYTELELLEKDAVQAVVASRAYQAALLDRGALHLHALNYTLGLARAARAAGAQLFERSAATACESGAHTRVLTSQGQVTARFVVLCCNAYIDRVAPQLAPRVMPVGTYMIATEPLGHERITTLLKRNIAVSDASFILDYFRRTADDRLLFGGGVSYSGLHSFRAASAIRKRMLRVFPQLRDVKIDFAWGGLLDLTRNRAPDFGRVGPNVYYVQGFSGHGIALAGMAGKLTAQAIAGQAERFDWFQRIPHRNFPGGRALRMPVLVLAMLWYRMRDALGV